MLNGRALWIATAVGTVLQVGMVVGGHYSPAITRLFAVGGMGISLVAGLVYGLLAGRGSTGGFVVGGLLAGAICAFVGILVSRLLGDVPTSLLALGTLSSAVTGAIGGGLARLFRRGSAAAATGAAAALVLASAALSGVAAQQTATVSAPPAAAAPRATTADFAWLAGRWQGTIAAYPGAVAEVVFAPPAAGLITGVMRLTSGGKVLIVELISVVDTPNGVEMRFRHFSPELTAYETDYRQAMRLTTFSSEKATFENQVAYDKALMSTQPRTSTFAREGADAFVAHSDIIGDDGKPATIEVKYRRAGA